MKLEVGRVNATPSKRLFQSIIADYDLARSICELIDNALDVWARGQRTHTINIDVELNVRQQTISVIDNAGGVDKEDLRNIVAPGESNNQLTDETIGFFGVGTKRAVVALAQDIKIKTRTKAKQAYQVEFDDNWISEPEWDIPIYSVDEVPTNTTQVILQSLRIQISDELVAQLREHLRATYGVFLARDDVNIKLNDEKLSPIYFENWAYPPSYEPRRYSGKIETADKRVVRVDVVAGLINESSPSAGEYGVYFYCNDRLVARALKTFEVGFTKGLAGLPHPKVSLTRVIVRLNGDARSMPWNSSKSDISTKHEVFVSLRDWLVQVVKSYATLSRIWIGEWPSKVFRHKKGNIQPVAVLSFPEATKSFLPPLPRSRPRLGQVLADKNTAIAKRKPWVRGLFEAVAAVDLISKQHFQQKNRIALIILDSTLEIAFKDYLVNESGAQYSDSTLLSLFANRINVQNEIKKYVHISQSDWKKVTHYYRLRNKLVHERTTVGVADSEIADFRELVERILTKLHKLRFS
jgi:hypothetical protein